jgi:E3 ubiquitin-protein ligase MYCBP2
MCYYLFFIFFKKILGCYLQEFCGKTSVCGHYCRGIKDEETCLPCLSCPYGNAKQTANDICAICYTDALPAKPNIQVRFPVFVFFCCVIDYWF